MFREDDRKIASCQHLNVDDENKVWLFSSQSLMIYLPSFICSAVTVLENELSITSHDLH